MKAWWNRVWRDTLFKRLFVLMWVALVISHLLAFNIATRVAMPEHPGPGPGPGGGPGASAMLRPDLPPMGAPPPPREQPEPGLPGEVPQGMSAGALSLDYLVRFIAIGIAAWFGARWLSRPMRELSNASEGLGRALGEGRALPVLDTEHGTLEVRQTAQVFNTMAQQLRNQFDAQSLMLAAISHDLRTPLSRLRLRLETMDEQAQTQRCIADVRVMDALIGGVLEMLRDSHSRSEPERIDVGALAQALVDDLADQGQPASMACEGAAPADAAIVLAQPGTLARVLGNLIGNALRYGGSARVAITLEAREVRVEVDDDGPGIPEEQLDAVFEPFFRVEASRARDAGDTGGAGLGLYIARDLARRNGGRLTLANRPEGGLRAMLVLPRA